MPYQFLEEGRLEFEIGSFPSLVPEPDAITLRGNVGEDAKG